MGLTKFESSHSPLVVAPPIRESDHPGQEVPPSVPARTETWASKKESFIYGASGGGIVGVIVWVVLRLLGV